MDQGVAGLEAGAVIDGAIRAYQQGSLREASAGCDAVLIEQPRDMDALNLLALIACDQGDPASALAILDEVLADHGDAPVLQNTAARALAALGRLDEAEVAYRRAWAAGPTCPVIANNLGCLVRDRGRGEEAVGWFETARQLMPGSAEVARNLAGAHAACGRFDDALVEFRCAIALEPETAASYAQCGAMLLAAGRIAPAAKMLRAALSRAPEDAASLNNLGLALRAERRTHEAIKCFQAAARHDPGLADAHYNLGCLLALGNRQDEARACHDRALAATPLHGPALWARCMVELPVLYGTAEQVAQQRTRYAGRLAELDRQAANPAAARALAAAAGMSQPFFLPYQGQCDRALQAQYGALMARLLQGPAGALAGPPRAGERVRLGIVSGFFHEHTLWRLMLKGWLRHIDRDRFEVTAYHTGLTEDEQTALARQLCPRFVTGSAQAIRDAILADRPHALLYPEIGMDRVAARLGAERLAPLQCVAWGQPVTTGLPTMDVFLSGAAMEPKGAADHYTERLVQLPGLGICYEADERGSEATARLALGLRADAVVFWCGQALYKYLPQYDDVFPRIAMQVGDCQFLFIGFAEDPAVTAQFASRLHAAFARHGLDGSRYVRIVDPMPQAGFLGSVRAADMVLDSIGWSGGKSTLDLVAEAPVIVTHEGAFMRGRHTAAILRSIGITETIAATTDAYCDLAVRLARDPTWRADLRARMATGGHRVTADLAPIRAMEAVLAGTDGGAAA